MADWPDGINRYLMNFSTERSMRFSADLAKMLNPHEMPNEKSVLRNVMPMLKNSSELRSMHPNPRLYIVGCALKYCSKPV